jgi:hypothetical protein
MTEDRNGSDKLPLLNPRPDVNLPGEAEAMLGVKMPVRFGNLDISAFAEKKKKSDTPINPPLTTSIAESRSNDENLNRHTRNHCIWISIANIPVLVLGTINHFTSSTMTLGDMNALRAPNSRARDWDRARMANLPVAKAAHIASPLI